MDCVRVDIEDRYRREGDPMTVKILQEALCNESINQQATEAARDAAVTARQETAATVTRMNERVVLDVAKATHDSAKLPK